MPHGRSIRILTYNVHSCIGTDRKIDPGRVAAVIKEARVDIVALQEIDVRRHRTGGVDQAGMIASLLKMEAHFNPALTPADEQYGDALITDLPTKAIKAGPFAFIGRTAGGAFHRSYGGRQAVASRQHPSWPSRTRSDPPNDDTPRACMAEG